MYKSLTQQRGVLTHSLPVPLEAAGKRALVLVDEAQGVAKLVQHSRPIHKAKVHREALFRQSGGICAQVGPRPLV